MPTTWNPSDSAANIALSNGNLTATGYWSPVGIAVDLTARKAWLFNPQTGKWNNDTLANQNPATGTGGLDISAATGALFPMWSPFTTNATGTVNFGASAFLFVVPSGFSAWDAACTWNPSDKNAAITLSGGNLSSGSTAASSWVSVRGTTGHSTGKFYFEATPTYGGTDSGWIIGVGNASASLSSFAGSSSSAVGFQIEGSVWPANTHWASFATPDATWRSIRATTSQAAGKLYFEVTGSAVFSNGLIFGVGSAAASIGSNNFVGNDAFGIGAQWGFSAIYNNGASVAPSGGPGAGTTMGCAIDFTAHKVWFFNAATGKWNNDTLANQNPATGAGGVAFSGSMTGAALFPMVSIDFRTPGADVATANFGATTFSNSMPSGFTAWDAGGVVATFDPSKMFLVMR